MGVHGLWQLLQPSGRPVSLESLEGKVLAVDVSIWLHQTMKGMRDKDGNPLPNAHLQGLFSRVCKLLFYRIKPVFVFDGGVPVLKKQTMAARRERKAEAERESTDIAQKLLQNLIKSQAVKQAIGSTGGPPTRVPGVRKRKGQQDSDMFELQPLPETEEVDLTLNASEWDRDFEMQENWIREGLAALSDTNPDSEEFKSLPMEIQHEILNELREQRKYHSLSRLTKMPEDSDDFSSYQLKKLMKQSRLSTRIDKVRKEMLNKTAEDITYSMGDDYYGDEVEARRIVSEDASHYVLIKGMTKRKQEEEAEKYELQKRVKLEKEEEDDSEYGGGNQSEGKSENTSPSANEKEQSSNVYSDSDSDVETVMSRRFRKKKYERRWNAEGVAMKLREGKNKSSTGGKQVSSKNAAACQKEAEVVRASKPSPIDESSSEDEGFIEVTVDPSAAIEEDDLFPASIFETNVEPNNEEMVDSVLNETKSSKSERKSGKVVNGSEVPPKPSKIHAKVNKKERSKETTEDTPAPAISEADDEAAAKRRSVLTDILSQLQRKKQDLTEHLPEVENEEAGMSEPEGEDQVAESDVHVSVSSDQQENEEDFSMSGGFFRDDTSDDDDENLQVKEAVGKESIPSASTNDTATDETSDDNKNFHDQQAGRKKSIASPTIKYPGASETREKTDTVSHAGKKYESSEAANVNEMETLSDSDEDLKLAIQLSLQTAESEGVIETGKQELLSKSGDSKVVNSAENNDDSQHRGLKMPPVSEKSSTSGQGKLIVKSKKTAVPEVVSSESDDDNEDDGSDFEEVTSVVQSSQSSDVISDEKSLHESIDDVEFLQETIKEKENTKKHNKNQRNTEISDSNNGSDEEGMAVSVQKDEEKEEGKSSVDEIPQDRLQPEDFEMDEDVATYFHTLNEDDLMDINSELDSERSALLSERGRQTRMATSVTEQINLEAQELLQLFGIPFIVSPMEAEAQCAFLDITDQTQGTITDDSDIWLFGGRRMYKNFFNQNKHVEFFTFDGIHNHFGLGREQLINIALLCGSDYTEGIQGVGPVRALEIMAEFPGEGLQGLYMFRKWWDKAKKQKTFVPESKARARLKDLMVIPGFPSEALVDAYLNPTVDDSLEKFSWSLPDLDMLRDFAKHKFGWSKEKTDQSLVPMMKQLNKKESQGRIYAYFQPENFVQASKIKSDRLKKALELVRNPRQATEQSRENIDEDETVVSSGSGNKRAPGKKAKKKKPKKQAEENVEEKDDDGDDVSEEEKKVKKKKKVRFASTAAPGLEEEMEENGKKKSEKGGKSSMDEQGVTEIGSSSVVNEESKDTEVGEVCDTSKSKPVGSIRQSKEEKGDGFMQAMAEKVKQATKKLEEMKGKGRGRGRGEKQNVRGRGRVMISLDQKQKPRKGQRSTIKRGGGGPRGRGAVNLSESSSDSGDDEDDAPDYKGESGDGAVKSKNVRQQSHQPEEDMLSKVTVSKPKPPKPAMQKKSGTTSKPEQKKPVKTSANYSRVSHTNSADLLGKDKGLKRKQSSVDCESQAAKETREIKVVKSRAERLQDAGGNSEKEAEQVSPEEHLVDKSIRNNPCREMTNSAKKNHESVKERTQTQPKTAEKMKTRPHAVSSGQKNVPVEDQSPSIRDKTKSRMRKDESNGELRAETGTQLENNTNLENETQETNASNTEEQTEEIDIRKADVSIINKQNLPATLTYLNQRSREDKFLLHQLTGRKMQNAVEKRLEESERRSKLETKEATKPTVTKPVEENLSFEDMLGGMDVAVTEKVQKKSKKEKAQAERRKSADSEDSRAASDQALALRNRIAKQIGQVNTVLAGTKAKDRSSKKSEERDTRVRTGDDEAGSEQPVTYGKVGEKVKLPKGGTVSFKSAETSQKDEEKVGFGSSDENMDWIDSGPVAKKNSQTSKEKDSLKSRRSAAFDKPIGSDDYSDSKIAKKSKFQKQLEHLDDGRSVKGLGYVPYQSESTGNAVRGRAFAGKGKGRGKNRNRGDDTGGNEWAKTMQPNAPDIRASRDVTEDEIMEYADMNADDLGSDFSDFEM